MILNLAELSIINIIMYLKVIKYIYTYTTMLQCLFSRNIFLWNFRTTQYNDVKKDDGEPSISRLVSKPGARAQTTRRDGPGRENPQ